MSNQLKTSRLSDSEIKWRTRFGPWAVVTGASGGIGRGMALHLAKTGLNLVLVARRRSLLDQMAAELSARYAIQTRVIDADLGQMNNVQSVLQATTDLDVGLLVASAGFGSSGRLTEAELSEELNMIDVNCKAVLAMSQHFGQCFARQRRGGIVLMSSLLAFQGVPFSANYAATKAYVQSLAEALHVELAPYGVAVLASAPGPIASGFASRAAMNMATAGKASVVAVATLSALGKQTTVRPGWLSIAPEGMLSPLPRRLRVLMMGRIMQGLATGVAH